MKIKQYLPSHVEIVKEGIIVLGGVLLAALILSRFPSVKRFVQGNSLTVNDQNNNQLY
jgi:hypothetical protein